MVNKNCSSLTSYLPPTEVDKVVGSHNLKLFRDEYEHTGCLFLWLLTTAVNVT